MHNLQSRSLPLQVFLTGLSEEAGRRKRVLTCLLIGQHHSGKKNNLIVQGKTYSFKNIPCTGRYVCSKTKWFVEDIIIHFCCIPTIKWGLKQNQKTKRLINITALKVIEYFFNSHYCVLICLELSSLIVYFERFSFKCRKTKSKVITLVNHNRHR